jgi:HAD superfamily hydrolase (TIGR01509 family)
MDPDDSPRAAGACPAGVAGQLAAFMADVWREYLGTANTGLIEYARRLRPRYRTGILSNSFVGAREREQAAYGFEDRMDEIVYSHEAGMSKPHRRVYALICARLDVRANETVFLDDKDLCVDGARETGLHAVPLPGQRPGHRRDREATHRPLNAPTARNRKRNDDPARQRPSTQRHRPGNRDVALSKSHRSAADPDGAG